MATGRDEPESSEDMCLSQIPRAITPASTQSQARRGRIQMSKSAALLSLLAIAPTALAQGCISLENSRACSAFNASSVSTEGEVSDILYGFLPRADPLGQDGSAPHIPRNTSLPDYSPFLKFVDDVESFDQQLTAYIETGWVERQYVHCAFFWS